mmetsp:Transcript_13910/g.20812  ORF Transcript_13910/g.20812 Transcript_13910/m.20812 type:complete len:107 (-) Transcript_13910:110-430(-)
MDEVGWLLLLVIAVVSLALLLTYMVDKKITASENDSTAIAEETIHNNEVKGKSSDDSLKQEAANDGGWKCACEGGGIFLPPSLMRSVGGPSAFMRAGAGNCYHKQM